VASGWTSPGKLTEATARAERDLMTNRRGAGGAWGVFSRCIPGMISRERKYAIGGIGAKGGMGAILDATRSQHRAQGGDEGVCSTAVLLRSSCALIAEAENSSADSARWNEVRDRRHHSSRPAGSPFAPVRSGARPCTPHQRAGGRLPGCRPGDLRSNIRGRRPWRSEAFASRS